MRSARSSTLSGRGLLPFFGFMADRAAVPGDLSDWNRQSGRFELKVSRSAGGFEPLPLTVGPDDHAQASPSNGVPDDIGGEDWAGGEDCVGDEEWPAPLWGALG